MLVAVSALRNASDSAASRVAVAIADHGLGPGEKPHMSKNTKQPTATLTDIVAAVQKQFGNESIRLLDGEAERAIDAISSGCLALDRALGIGGYPRGRIVEIYGPESSGKT